MSDRARRQAMRSVTESASMCITDGIGLERADEMFGEDVFNLPSMKEYLPPQAYEKLLVTIRDHAPLDPDIANDVAGAMKTWALERGASHYTHWFLPLTGGTAEKHDAFLEPDHAGGVMLKFSGKNLIVGESDASSFPSGGLRSTFEARGYTAWDPTSPAFLRRTPAGATLCIPTAFRSYTGEALDKKTPLLRSISALSAQIRRMLDVFEMKDGGSPEIMLGVEQEYFLIDRSFYLARPDLIQTGRTLFGAAPPKHQQLDDHYYGSIKARVLAYMTEVDQTLWRLGIPAKTRHNEAAPAQFEIAAVYEEMNLSSDHNMLTMDVLRQIADRHGFVCLLHEKPFDGVNGSGKHNNWSFGTNKMNFLSPGKSPEGSAIFLTALCAVIRAVDLHGELLRMATASSGNSYRLGANEAPPAIMSVYLGDELTRLIEELESGTPGKIRKGDVMQLFVDTLPPLPQDATDRNRTSPFAYTGHKFEFRSPGSSQSCAGPNVVLNTIVAESLDYILTELEKVPRAEFKDALQALLRRIVKEHRRIIFNGDNYSAEWFAEATKRGLPVLRSVPEALAALVDEKSMTMFERFGVFTRAELFSRHEVYFEEYCTRTRIEGELALTLSRTLIRPAVCEYRTRLLTDLQLLQQTGIRTGQAELITEIEQIGERIIEMIRYEVQLESALPIGDPEEVRVALGLLRNVADQLEKLIDDELWPLPKYREMLFIY